MQHIIHIRDELVLEAHLDTNEPHILLRREGEPGTVRVYLGDVRWARWWRGSAEATEQPHQQICSSGLSIKLSMLLEEAA